MLYSPGIVLIDNEQSELDQLRDAFYDAGLPCLAIRYVSDDPGNTTGIDHVAIPKSVKIRMLFLDLNLQESLKLDAVNLVGPIEKIIKKLSPEGPYALIFWSKYTEEPKTVLKYLEERFWDRIPLPILCFCMDKSQFKSIENGNSKNDLRDKLLSMIGEDHLFKSIADWEGRVAQAAGLTVDGLHLLARPNVDYTINSHRNNLVELFTAIANETLGKKLAIDNPGLAINQGLMPVLYDRLFLINDEMDALWKNCLPQIGSDVVLDEKHKAVLNSYFHVENTKTNYPVTGRGVFVELNEEIMGQAEKKEKFEKHLGNKIKPVLMDEFISCKQGSKEERETVRGKTKIGFLEISAECDHAQKKVELHKYVLGVMIPLEYVEFTYFHNDKEEKRLTSHEGIYRLPPVRINNDDYVVKFSFKYQIGTHGKNSWFGKPIFRVREQILADIVFRCAQYSSRPGIISFN